MHGMDLENSQELMDFSEAATNAFKLVSSRHSSRELLDELDKNPNYFVELFNKYAERQENGTLKWNHRSVEKFMEKEGFSCDKDPEVNNQVLSNYCDEQLGLALEAFEKLHELQKAQEQFLKEAQKKRKKKFLKTLFNQDHFKKITDFFEGILCSSKSFVQEEPSARKPRKAN